MFAFFATGVTIGGFDGLTDALTDTVTLEIIARLVVGKTVGIFGTTYLLSRFTGATLDANLRWLDVAGVSVLAGIRFTVSLLIGDLAFGAGTPQDTHVKIGVLVGTVLATLLASGILSTRNRAYRRVQKPKRPRTTLMAYPTSTKTRPGTRTATMRGTPILTRTND